MHSGQLPLLRAAYEPSLDLFSALVSDKGRKLLHRTLAYCSQTQRWSGDEICCCNHDDHSTSPICFVHYQYTCSECSSAAGAATAHAATC